MSWQFKPVAQELTGGRLHLQHGPIDIVLKAWGRQGELAAAYRAAVQRFETILDECVADLRELRRPMSDRPAPQSSPGRRMTTACGAFSDVFITPMAAVAGAVADEVLESMTSAAELSRAYVNNGGDIAVWMAIGESLQLGIAGDFCRTVAPRTNGKIRLQGGTGVGGVATSGAHGRSFSLGIADSVTVLASSAAQADAAATVIANAVDIEDAGIVRRPASALDPDSDLGDRLVTMSVGRLTQTQVRCALARGAERARQVVASGIAGGATLMLQGSVEIVGAHAVLPQPAIEREPLI